MQAQQTSGFTSRMYDIYDKCLHSTFKDKLHYPQVQHGKE